MDNDPTFERRITRLETQNENDRQQIARLSEKLDKIILGIATQALITLSGIVLHSMGLIK